MLEAYSTAVSVVEGQDIIFQTVKENNNVVSGSSGNASLYLNATGNYIVAFNLTATPAEAGTVAVQMFINGSADVRTSVSQTVAADETANVSFVVPVTHRSCCCRNNGTALTFRYTGTAGIANLTHVTIWRVA